MQLKLFQETTRRMSTVPIDQAIEATGVMSSQRLATVFDGITRHSPEGLAFKRRSEAVGWKQAVEERDQGTYDWTRDREIGGGVK